MAVNSRTVHRTVLLPAIVVCTVLAVAVTLAAGAAQALASTFSDVTDSHPAHSAVESLAARGIIAGTGDGLFLPDNSLTRGQAAKILVKWRGQEPGQSADVAFRDLDATYIDYVEKAAALGWVRGYPDGTFKPYAALTREQLAVIVIRSLDRADEAAGLSGEAVEAALSSFTDRGSISAGARPYVALAVQSRLFSGDKGLLNPLNPITRAQFCLVLARADAGDSFTEDRPAPGRLHGYLPLCTAQQPHHGRDGPSEHRVVRHPGPGAAGDPGR